MALIFPSPLLGKPARKSIQCSECFSVPKSLILRLEQQDRSREVSCPGCMQIIREMQLSSGSVFPPPRRVGVAWSAACGEGSSRLHRLQGYRRGYRREGQEVTFLCISSSTRCSAIRRSAITCSLPWLPTAGPCTSCGNLPAASASWPGPAREYPGPSLTPASGECRRAEVTMPGQPMVGRGLPKWTGPATVPPAAHTAALLHHLWACVILAGVLESHFVGLNPYFVIFRVRQVSIPLQASVSICEMGMVIHTSQSCSERLK